MEGKDGIHERYLQPAVFLEGASERDLEKEGGDMQVEPTLTECMDSARSLPVGTFHRRPSNPAKWIMSHF